VKYGGAVLGGGLLAGCTGNSGGGSTPESTETETATPSPTETEATTETETDDGPYSVEMYPVGEVEFEEVPETWLAEFQDAYGDMAVALGQADGNKTQTLGRFKLWYDLLGIEFDADFPSTWNDGGYSKEVFFELDPDVNLNDPNLLMQWDSNFKESDLEAVAENTGPFFSCYNRRVNTEWQLEAGYPDRAPTMLEAFEKVGEVFKQEERAAAFVELHEEVQTEVQSKLEGVEPAEIGLINGGSDMKKGEFYPLDPTRGGYEMKHFRDLNVEDGFADINDDVYGGTIDYEELLEVDPDILVVHWDIVNDLEGGGWNPEMFRTNRIEPMKNDPIGQELTAVQNDNVIPGAYPEQGPIVNLFSTEVTAQTLYPEQFGEFSWEQYPEVPKENQLFDRDRVRDIVNGNI
jgi:iron complex transport system substrate-binding protein